MKTHKSIDNEILLLHISYSQQLCLMFSSVVTFTFVCRFLQLLFLFATANVIIAIKVFLLFGAVCIRKKAALCPPWSSGQLPAEQIVLPAVSSTLLACCCVCECACVTQITRASHKSSPSNVNCVHLSTHFYLVTPLARHTLRTFFVVVANDGILHDISGAKTDAVLLAMGCRGSDLDSTLLALKVLLPLVVRPYLVTAHPPDQALALADGERLQKTLVYLHVLTKDIT